jgi:hypothetical protein
MDKLSKDSNQIKKATTTSRPPWWQSHPILLKGLSGLILAGLSFILKYQSPRVIIALYADVSKSNQEYKAFISVSFQCQRLTLPRDF